MKRFLLVCGVSARAVRAEPPLHYYDSAQGKTGPALRQALYQIIKDHTVVLWESDVNPDNVAALKVLEDPANTNNVLLVYSGVSMAKSNYGVNVNVTTHRASTLANSGSEVSSCDNEGER